MTSMLFWWSKQAQLVPALIGRSGDFIRSCQLSWWVIGIPKVWNFQDHYFVLKFHVAILHFSLLLLGNRRDTQVRYTVFFERFQVLKVFFSHCTFGMLWSWRTIESKTGAKVDIAREGTDGYRQGSVFVALCPNLFAWIAYNSYGYNWLSCPLTYSATPNRNSLLFTFCCKHLYWLDV